MSINEPGVGPDTEERAGDEARPLGFDVYGHFAIHCGLTVSALNTVSMLGRRGAAVRLHRLDASRETSVDQGSIYTNVNLFHINPSAFRSAMAFPHHDPHFENRINIAVPFWELAQIPRSWDPILASMDLVLAPTTFVANAVAAALPETAIELILQSVDVPQGVLADRHRFGLPEGAFVVGTSFAAESALERKNPWATIRSFQMAFPQERDVALVVRATSANSSTARRVRDSLRALSGNDSRILFPEEPWSYADVVSMYASLNVYVSLHRAEGLGLGLLESMAVGTPVMATGWSGNMDFMTAQNSMLVDYDMVPVEVPTHNPYSQRSMGRAGEWAEPRIEDAATKLRALYQDPGLRHRLSETARRDVEARRLAAAQAEFVDRVSEHMAQTPLDGPVHQARAAALRRIERRQRLLAIPHRARPIAVNVVKRTPVVGTALYRAYQFLRNSSKE